MSHRHDPEPGPRPRRSLPPSVRIAVSAGILVLLLAWIGPAGILQALLSIHPGWVALAFGLTLGQVALLAWRWQVTARRLGLHLPWQEAAAEYYRAIVLNQLLPGGVLGDVSRAWRHAKSLLPEPSSPPLEGSTASAGKAAGGAGAAGMAVRAVVLERVSAQLLMTGWGICAFLLVAFSTPETGAFVAPVLAGTVTAILVATGLIVAVFPARRFRAQGAGGDAGGDTLLGRSWREAKEAVLAPAILPFQLVTGTLLVASYIGGFVLAALAVGIAAPGVGSASAGSTPLVTVALLAAPVLLGMLLPVSWAGWGVREAGAAGLWGLAGLPPAEGVLVSVAYGSLVLVTSLPAALLLLRRTPGASVAGVRPGG